MVFFFFWPFFFAYSLLLLPSTWFFRFVPIHMLLFMPPLATHLGLVFSLCCSLTLEVASSWFCLCFFVCSVRLFVCFGHIFRKRRRGLKKYSSQSVKSNTNGIWGCSGFDVYGVKPPSRTLYRKKGPHEVKPNKCMPDFGKARDRGL